MFYQIRYQTGEIEDMVAEMKKGNIPCMDVDNMDEFNWVVKKLEEYNIYLAKNIPFDKNARDRVKEPEFEFRAAFSSAKTRKTILCILTFILSLMWKRTMIPYSETDNLKGASKPHFLTKTLVNRLLFLTYLSYFIDVEIRKFFCNSAE